MHRQMRKPMSEQLRKAMDDLGAEPLSGSDFEDEAPDQEFTDTAPADPSPHQ
jgi:hypothetical protein